PCSRRATGSARSRRSTATSSSRRASSSSGQASPRCARRGKSAAASAPASTSGAGRCSQAFGRWGSAWPVSRRARSTSSPTRATSARTRCASRARSSRRRRVLPPGRLRLLELGCGTGNVLAALAEFGMAVGMETHPDLAAAARAAGLDVRPGRLPGDLVVEPGWADAVLLLDVLEHLDDDVAALVTARRALRPGGLLVITVPAYRWLWSGHDVALGHRRRYTARELSRVVERAGL